jgi:hypothetical protein
LNEIISFRIDLRKRGHKPVLGGQDGSFISLASIARLQAHSKLTSLQHFQLCCFGHSLWIPFFSTSKISIFDFIYLTKAMGASIR